MSLYGEAKMGLIFPTLAEDHRRPNIIRGNGAARSPRRRKAQHQVLGTASGMSSLNMNWGGQNVVEVQDIGNGHHGLSFVQDENGSLYITDEAQHNSMMLQQDSSASDQPSENEQLVQTEDGNFVLMLRDNTVVSVQENHSQLDPNSADAFWKEEELLLMNNDSGEVELISSDLADADDTELDTAVQSIDTNSECNPDLLFQGSSSPNGHITEEIVETSEVEPEHQIQHGVDNSFVVVQLTDGSSVLVPAASLDGLNLMADGGQSLLVDENGRLLFPTSNSSDFSMASMDPLSLPKSSHSSASRKRKQPNNSHNNVPVILTKRVNGNGNFSTKVTNGGRPGEGNSPRVAHPPKNRAVPTSQPQKMEQPNFVNHYVPNSNCASASQSKQKTQEDLKPRPFRFELPEDEETNPSSDYLSLVIEQFQKEHLHKM